MVRADNQRRQDFLDKEGIFVPRTLDFLSPSFRDPSFELVALHPRHFLPQPGNVLSIYDPVGNLFRHYTPAHDLYLRETMTHTSDPLPTIFPPQRASFSAVNVFLVAINAEIKLRRFEAANGSLPLPPSHVALARRTMELVDLLYWKPRPTQGSRGAELVQTAQAARQNHTRRSRPKTGSTKESGEDEPEPAAAAPSLVRKRRNLSYPADADLETRMAYGRALMCGHDRDYPPELFEDAIPLPDVAPLYSSEADLQTWRNRVYGAADVQTDGNDVPRS